MLGEEVGPEGRAEETTYAGLMLRYPKDVCQHRCYATQVRGLLACIYEHMDMEDPEQLQATFPLSLIAQQTQLGYMHLSTNLRMYSHFTVFQKAICEEEQRMLKNAFSMLAGGQNHYALNYLLGPGHQVTKWGAVAYVYKCHPVDATRAEHNNCTQEIPVWLNKANKTLRFADPITRVLAEYATTIPCNPLAPPRWYIDGTWYCSYPEMEICASEPAQLKPGNYKFEEENFTAGLGGSIFSTDQIEQHRRAMLLHRTREAQPIVNS